jgi:hypothetical protein
VAKDRFLDLPRTPVTTSQGDVELPVLYRDLSSILAFFRVEHARAADVLSSTPFMPVRFGTGFAVAGLAMFDYRDCTLGAYRECALTVAAVPRSRTAPAVPLLDLLRPAAHRGVGFHILDLPVTTVLADVAGRELWGFPKFVTTIDLEVGSDSVRGAVAVPGGCEPIVIIEGTLGRGFILPPMDHVVYSSRGDETLRTLIKGIGKMHTTLGGHLTVRVGASSRMASHLAALGLDGARPSLVQVCDHGQMVLQGGEALVQARAA